MTIIQTRRSFLKTATLATAGVVGTSLGMPSIASARATTLKLAHTDSNLHPNHRIAEQLARDILEATDGAVEIQVFAAGQLGSSANIATGVTTGTIDLIMNTSGFLSALFPKFQLLDLPFLFKDSATAERVLDGDVGKEIFASVEEKSVYGLAWGTNGWRVLDTARKQVNTPEDMKGLKIRIQQSPVYVSMIEALDAIPVALDTSEMYLALSQNVVDGYDFPLLGVVASKLYEVTGFVAETNHVYNACALLGNKRKLDRLEAKHLEALRETMAGFSSVWRASTQEHSEQAKKHCEEAGVKFNTVEFEPFREKVTGIYDQFRVSLGEEFVNRAIEAAEL